MPSRVNREELPYSKGPYSYEYVSTRKEGKFRIRDQNDNAVGSADTENEARETVSRLNVSI